jgi:hypothetical protein
MKNNIKKNIFLKELILELTGQRYLFAGCHFSSGLKIIQYF